jgi:hypothetical protein
MNAFGTKTLTHDNRIAGMTITVYDCTPEFIAALVAWVQAGNFAEIPCKGYMMAHAKRASEHGMQDIAIHTGAKGVTAVLANVPELPVEGIEVKWSEKRMAAPACPTPTSGWTPGQNLFAKK